jgi:translation initiation factor 5B
MDFTIPGLLFIDTPGHEAFTNLRRRGGHLADIAILVIDINEGIKPQTAEAIEILKSYKTPFVIAANKIDLIPGWRKNAASCLMDNIKAQSPEVIKVLDTKLYSLVGDLHERYAFSTERFDRVDDFTKQIAIIPCSAKTGEGLPEMLMMLTGLAQKFLEKSLELDISGSAKGTILEVKEEKGLGVTLDVIIYGGTLRVNDTIVIGSLEEPIVTKVRALFQPAPLAEMRDKKSKFTSVKEVSAATGVKISAPNIKEVIAGMPIRSCDASEVEKVKQEIQREIEEVLVETEKEGIVIKADALGSLEALTTLLRAKGVQIKKASVGDVSKKDVSDAEANYEKDPLNAVVLGFNVEVTDEIKNLTKKVTIVTNDVIYKLIEDFEAWQKETMKNLEARELDLLVRPCKISLLSGYVFRQSNPAIIGAEVVGGTAKTGMPIMKDGKPISKIKSMQMEKESVSKAEKGKKFALALEKVTVGRQIKEGDTLYSAIPEEDFRKMKQLKKYLTPDEIEVIKEIAKIMRQSNSVWGI